MAGAMLSAPACGGSSKQVAPVTPAAPAATETTAAPPPGAEPAVAPVEAAAPAADPCAGPAAAPEPEQPAATDVQASDKPAVTPTKKKKRPRGSGDKPVGRGFVLA